MTFFLFSRSPQKTKGSKREKMRMRNQVTELDWLSVPTNASPESALAIAVLQRAVLDIITPGSPKKARSDALEWINGQWGVKHENEHPFSFTRIIEGYFDLSPSEFRDKVLKFADKARDEHKTANNFRFQRG